MSTFPCSIRLFLPNSFQLGFALNVPRFLKALAEPSSHPGYPHPGLMNAIYLWALRLSREPSLQAHENIYLRRAIDALQNVLGGALGDLNDVHISFWALLCVLTLTRSAVDFPNESSTRDAGRSSRCAVFFYAWSHPRGPVSRKRSSFARSQLWLSSHIPFILHNFVTAFSECRAL